MTDAYLASVRKAAIERIAAALCAQFERAGGTLDLIVDLAVLVAQVDGEVDEIEAEALADSLAGLFGTRLRREVAQRMVRSSMATLRVLGAQAHARTIAGTLVTCDAVDDGLRLALLIGLASGGLSAVELDVIERVAIAAGSSRAGVRALADALEHDAGA